MGLIYQMIPFNFPYWLVFKSGFPSLAAGNTLMVRNSDSTPQCGLELEKNFLEAGFEEGVYQNIQFSFIFKSIIILNLNFYCVYIIGLNKSYKFS